MNIFELNVVTTPLGGAIGAIIAAKNQTLLARGGIAVMGLIAGIGIYFFFLWLISLTMKAGEKEPVQTKMKYLEGPILFCLLMVLITLPLVTAWGIHSIVEVILK
ncbi:MAG: hypothetical protein JJU29_17880 [Verrucomicrobia bacterium]|nr:hypothetical protein [Verrucomicrobiota bacterium]MCH8513885.1 hypothetical protein [Kiritimatiellia bacterium]